MSFTRFASSVALTCAALAVALPGCSSDQPEPGIGNLDMAVTLATPPAGPNEQIDTVNVSLYCDGMDPVLGVPRPPMSDPETFSINVSTSQGPEPYNTIGLLEKQGLPAGNCHLAFTAVSNTGNTECTGEITVAIVTNETTPSEVVLACIHTPRYGGLRTDGTFNQCAEYRQVLVTPITQAIGFLVDVETEVYDPDGDPVTVAVETSGACGNVQSSNGTTAASCETVSGCEAVVNTVECTGVGLCQIIVALSDDGFDSCTGLLPDGSNNNAARRTIDVDCTVASGCGNGQLEPGEDCEPPNTAFCDEFCQDIFVCPPEASDPCDQSNECTPQTCAPDGSNQPVCTDDPQTGGTCDLGGGESGTCNAGQCAACVNAIDCDDENDCTDDACDAGSCVNTPDDTNTCSTGDFDGTCNAGVCEGLCTPDPCPDAGVCVTNVCDPADGSCTPQDDGINTGCDLGGSSGVCDGAGTCVQCNMDSQCASGETCNNNVCEGAGIACEYEQDFETLDLTPSAALIDDGWLGFVNLFSPDGQNYLGGYVKAPGTEEGGLAAIEEGQGGAEQGLKQLVIISDYNNNAAQTAGERVEANTFQERTIVQDDVGKTIAFSFDAKRGNIGGASTANAFIKTFVDPGNLIDFLQVDTTAIADTWNPYSIEVVITGDLVGASLQFGFSATASNFEPSQVFYDNVTFGTPGCSGSGGGCVVDADCPDTGNDCTAAVCNAGICETANVADGAFCNGDTGTCNAGVCEPTALACEYEQDFETLDLTPSAALIDDGWLGFVNLFSPDGQNYLGGYVKAPGTEEGGLAAIEEGQGGAEQGLKQLVIISDYNNNAAQTAGERVEANTFQERTIVQDDVGKTIAFSFDAKRGNIGGASTANAFIKTFVDPGNLIDFLQVDTTAIADTWNPYSIEVVITGDLVGASLQFGFSATASNFEPSQVFYDNVTFGTPGCSGGGGSSCVGPALPNLTINGDFETGDTCGWEFFPNDGAFAAVGSPNNGGAFSGNLIASVPGGGGPPSFPVIKQANIGIGIVQPNSTATISFDLFGSVSGAGGVFFAEFFSELTGGGTSLSVILNDGNPLFPNGTWTTYTFNTPTGNDVSGGVTLQLKADCGANPGCMVDAYIDNVSVTTP